MKYLKKFSTDTDRIAYESSNDYIEPYVSLVEQDDSVHYNLPHDYSKDYFTTVARENGTISFNILKNMGTEYITSISYSTNNGNTWNTTNNANNKSEHLVIDVDVNEGDKILWKGDAMQLAYWDSGDYGDYIGSFFSSDCEFDAQGNIMSLLYGDNFKGQTTIENEYAFVHLFNDIDDEKSCGIVNARNLSLPATILTESCYASMFSNCKSLVTAPKLPAITLASYCYSYMFYGCTNLISAPELPATTLANSCYSAMFRGCNSLTTAPKLPAMTLTNHCYSNMFYDCTSLTTAPELPATELAEYCYNNMFNGCTSLTTAPELPATTLAENCYWLMFGGCTSLTTAPSVLPATTLANSCYSYMFQGCTSLTTAPELPATTLANYCYSNMFNGCTSLNSITCLATDISATNCTKYWVSNVAATGTFTKHPSMNNWTTGDNGIPEGWTTTDAVSENYLTFNILSDGIIKWKTNSSSTTVKTISYSINDGEWISITSSKTGASFNVSTGDKVRFKGNNNGYATSNNYYNNFDGSTASFDLEGNIMSLVDEVLFDYITTLNTDYTFSHLFYRTNVIRANNLVLPAITLSKYCYANMFGYCSLLTVAPILPATTLANYCYNCMFYNCTSLTTTPVLPATTLAECCYSWTFHNCTSLTSVPELPATVLVKSCYEGMFYGCTSLKYIKAMFTTTPSGDKPNCYTANWVYNVASIGIFIKSPAATWDVTGVHGIPTGWTVKTATE